MTVNRWPRRPQLDSEPVHIRFEVDRIASGFSPSTSFFLVAIIPPLLQTYLKYMLLLSEEKMDESLETSKNQCSFGNWEALDRKVFSLFVEK